MRNYSDGRTQVLAETQGEGLGTNALTSFSSHFGTSCWCSATQTRPQGSPGVAVCTGQAPRSQRKTDGGWQDWSGGLLIIKSREEHMVVDLSLITNRDQTDQEAQT